MQTRTMDWEAVRGRRLDHGAGSGNRPGEGGEVYGLALLPAGRQAV